jgi:hypothetical protein
MWEARLDCVIDLSSSSNALTCYRATGARDLTNILFVNHFFLFFVS